MRINFGQSVFERTRYLADEEGRPSDQLVEESLVVVARYAADAVEGSVSVVRRVTVGEESVVTRVEVGNANAARALSGQLEVMAAVLDVETTKREADPDDVAGESAVDVLRAVLAKLEPLAASTPEIEALVERVRAVEGVTQ